MTISYFKFTNTLAVVSLATIISFGCGGNQGADDENVNTTIDQPTGTGPIKVAGKLFSVPSPIQTALLIKQSGSAYNKDLLNPAKGVTNYSSGFQKALNLGIYGADLGYVTLYEQTQDAIMYMQSVKKLADELNITGAFDVALINRFQTNISNKDSLLVLVSTAYRSSDAYLKNNEREDISSLVLAGGWIETLHLAVNVVKTKNNPDIIRRIAEQKSSLKNLIELLSKYKEQAEVATLITNLYALQEIFEGVEFKYTYEKPLVEPDKKTTTINGKTEVKISPQQIDSISRAILTIRSGVVG